MSLKTSPSKKDASLSPSAILTRNQSTFLNTRQLRKKDQSRKKISEFTQMLMSPSRDKSIKATQSNKKKSPKDKKEKPKVPKKELAVCMTKLLPDKRKYLNPIAKKRKRVSIPKEVHPTKVSRTASPCVRSTLDLCEDQSLDDEDLLEILTCESPVWWEDPPDSSYLEEAIFKRSEDGYFHDTFQSSNGTDEHYAIPFEEEESPIKSQEKDNNDIKIPEIKQNDKKFMKKRNKLENVLGNIKNKLIDTPTEDNTATLVEIDKGKSELFNSLEKGIESNSKQTSKKQERGIKQMKTEKSPLEITSSSDDMGFGLPSDDILKDLENMDIPMKHKKNSEENVATEMENHKSPSTNYNHKVIGEEAKSPKSLKANENNTDEVKKDNASLANNMHTHLEKDGTREENNDVEANIEMFQISGNANRVEVSSSSGSVDTIDIKKYTELLMEKTKNVSITRRRDRSRRKYGINNTKNMSNSLIQQTKKSKDPVKIFHITSSNKDKITFIERESQSHQVHTYKQKKSIERVANSSEKDKLHSATYQCNKLKPNEKPPMWSPNSKGLLLYDKKIKRVEANNQKKKVRSRPIKKDTLNFESSRNTNKSKQNIGLNEVTGSGPNSAKIPLSAEVPVKPNKHGEHIIQNNTDSLSIKSDKYKDTVKIYFIDATSSNDEKITFVDSKSGPNKCTSIIKNHKLPSIESTSNSSNTNQESKEEFVSLSEPIKQSMTVNESCTKNIQLLEKTDSINNENIKSSNEKQVTSANKNTIKEEKEVKSNKSKGINKDQLMKVYKIITDESYRESYINTIKNEVEKINTSTNNIIKSSYGLESLLKTYNNKSYTNKRLKKEETEVNAVDDQHNEKTEKKIQNSNEMNVNVEKCINVNKINLKDDNQTLNDLEGNKLNTLVVDKMDNKTNIVAQTENKQQSNNENCTNMNKNKCSNSEKNRCKTETLCGNCDNTNTERSLHIKSDVKSAKYCLKCSSIFETETCSYCEKKLQTSQENRKNC